MRHHQPAGVAGRPVGERAFFSSSRLHSLLDGVEKRRLPKYLRVLPVFVVPEALRRPDGGGPGGFVPTGRNKCLAPGDGFRPNLLMVPARRRRSQEGV